MVYEKEIPGNIGKPPEIHEYKGSPVLCLFLLSGNKFSFGLRKAKIILANLEAIREFADSEGDPPWPGGELPE